MSIGRIDHNREIARDLDRCIAKKAELEATIAEQAATIEKLMAFVHACVMEFNGLATDPENMDQIDRAYLALTGIVPVFVPADMGEVE